MSNQLYKKKKHSADKFTSTMAVLLQQQESKKFDHQQWSSGRNEGLKWGKGTTRTTVEAAAR